MKPLNGESKKELYQICQMNDVRYDGSFYLGVLTTGIYCLPSCKAKMPLPDNIKFYFEREIAIKDGLRGCKRCRSEFYPNTEPKWFDDIRRLLTNVVNRKIDDEEIEKISNVNISTVRRYFKRYMNVTLAEFHRRERLKYAMNLIKLGSPILDLPYETGFSSQSGFRSAFKKEYGITPGEVEIK